MLEIERNVGRRRVACLVICALLTACGESRAAAAHDTQPMSYEASVTRTQYGVVHVRAADWKGLGYGHGYAAAQDNLCVLADGIVTFRGERSRYFGAAAEVPRASTLGNPPNLEADFFFRHLITDAVIDRYQAAQPPQLQALVTGYAAGYSRYVREVRAGADPGRHMDCRASAWLQEVTSRDVYRRMYALELTASSLRYLPSIAGALPPARQTAFSRGGTRRPASYGVTDDPGLGSNMIGFGSAATGTRHGLLFGNPHWYWDSIDRFYQVHLKLPGQIDVEGAAILGVPLPLIGFNKDVAWSHTVSTAARYTVYRLRLADHDPTSYVYDGQVRHMTQTPITVEVRNEDGSLGQVTRVAYDSHYGPMLANGWTAGEAFTLRDANAENSRAFENWLRWGRARSLEEFMRIQREEGAVPWVNTIAVGRGDGRVWYADIGAIPDVPDAKRAACNAGKVPDRRDIALDGSRPECEWDSDAASPQAGTFPARQLPQLLRNDYAANMNDSAWLSNPNSPLTGYPMILGPVDIEQSLRTRMGHILVRDRFAGTDGLPGHGASSETVRQFTLNARNLSAELFLDDVLGKICPAGIIEAESGSPATVDIREACKILATWDRHGNSESVGALVWDRFWESAQRVAVAERYRVPFDAAAPLDTPRGLNTDSRGVVQAFAVSVRDVLGSHVPLAAPVGAYQYLTGSAGRSMPLAGGCGPEGYFTVVCTKWTGKDISVSTHGNSYMQVVTFDTDGVEPYTLLVPSQSTDPASPHYRDYTRAYSEKTWLRAPFTDAEVKSEAIETVRLRGP